MPEKPWFGPFWRFIGNFRNAKILKLKVPNIEGIALGKDGQHDHLVPLLSLQGLRLEGPCDPGRRGDATVALANFLRCCPMMNSLQIQIVNPTNHYDRRGREPAPDFGVSLDLFEGNFTKEITAMIDAADGSSQVADLPGLSGCEFDCLRYHLKNVKLEFELNLMKELNTFEVSLAKFFAENCSVLENLQIDDIKHNFYCHINWIVDRWRADALEQRKQMKQDSAN
jgi:hypothetical protein